MLNSDTEAAEELKKEKQCSSEVSNAVTQNQSAVLRRESEKSTVDMTHVDSHPQLHQHTDTSKHQQTNPDIPHVDEVKLKAQEQTLPTLKKQNDSLKQFGKWWEHQT